MISLYCHTPYCLSKCPYCDFFSLGWGDRPLPEQEFSQALTEEMLRWSRWLREKPVLQTVFFGGGTPSLLSVPILNSILEATRRFFNWADDAEVTLEMNPKTADREKLAGFRGSGVNRISMGIQSLDNGLLKTLGRAHSREEALESLEWVLASGFRSCNVDLMYGLPDQSITQLATTLDALAPYPLPHLSAYELILEEQTPFFEQYRYESQPLPTGEVVLSMRRMVEEFAKSQGLQRYEISNFSLPQMQCRHNLAYWNYESFVGLGPSAVSFLRLDQLSEAFFEDFPMPPGESEPYGVRLVFPKWTQGNKASPIESIQVEWIYPQTAALEFFMMGLRKANGIRLDDFTHKFSTPLPSPYQEAMERGRSLGWLESSAEGHRLTATGVVMSNEVIQLFMN